MASDRNNHNQLPLSATRRNRLNIEHTLLSRGTPSRRPYRPLVLFLNFRTGLHLFANVFPILAPESYTDALIYTNMTLNMLPSEVLAQILDSENSWAALELWKTGDRALCTKLVNGGITHLNLRQVSTGKRVCWPRCLKEFRLRSLSFTLSVIDTLPPFYRTVVPSELMRLHPCLETLSLEFPGALRMMSSQFTSQDPNLGYSDDRQGYAAYMADSLDSMAGEYEDGDLHIPFRKRPKTESSTSEATLSDTWNPARAFATLKILKLLDSSFNLPLTVASLPSVTDLTIRSAAMVDCSLLTSLESLTISDTSVGDNPMPTILSCPQTLTSIDVASIRYPSLALIDFLLDTDTTTRFPHLTSIRGMLELKSELSSISRAPTALCLGLLPLPTFASDWLGPEKLALTKKVRFSDVLPHLGRWSNLSTLRLQSSDFLPSDLHLLPRTLQHLLYIEADEPKYEEARNRGLASIQGSDASAWSIHKQELLSYGSTREGRDMTWVKTYIDRVENGSLCGLPLSLLSLQVGTGFTRRGATQCQWLSFAEALVLPPKLCEFGRDAMFSAGSHFLELLPPYINSLELTFFAADDPINIDEYTRFTSMPWIRTMALSFRSSFQASQALPLLPRTLNSIILYIVPGTFVEVACLASLPARLERLRIKGGDSGSNARWLQYLPRHLTFLDADWVTYADDLVNLPPTLTTLTVELILNPTIADLLSLPRSLSTLTGLFKLDYPRNRKPKKQSGVLNKLQWRHIMDTYQPFWRIFEHSQSELRQSIKHLL